MKCDFDKMTDEEIGKGSILIITAKELGISLGGYGELAVNKNSGNVYLWLEDYPATLFIRESEDAVMVAWSDPYDGEEVIEPLDSFGNGYTSIINDIYDWCRKLEVRSSKKQVAARKEN